MATDTIPATKDNEIPETVIPPVAGPASRRRAADQARTRHAGAVAEAEAAEKRIAIVERRDPVALNQPAEDSLGRELPKDDPTKARAMQRGAVLERQARVLEDTDRVNHGLPPKWATE